MPDPPYRIDPDEIRRFDARRTAFMRARDDHQSDRRRPAASDDHEMAAPTIDPDRSRPALAEARASWRVEHLLQSAPSEGSEGEPVSRDDPAPPRHLFATPIDAAANIKAVAMRFGGCLVGITRTNPLWLYSHDSDGRPVELPEGIEFAVVIAVQMPRDQIRQSPGPLAAAAVGRGYSAMAAVTASVAEYLHQLGYRAIPCGNDTALSIPLAIDAGLGALGRSGLLLTPEFGPFVRLCKVFTDLPLMPDEPKAISPEAYCATCDRCATACPAGAISDAPEPSFETAGSCNRPGVFRWAVDAASCLAFWRRNGTSCATCIATCPYGLE